MVVNVQAGQGDTCPAFLTSERRHIWQKNDEFNNVIGERNDRAN
jgi:hypothetical protein